MPLLVTLGPMTIVPLTERVLNRLGPPRALWIVLWAGVSGAVSAVAYLTGSPIYPGRGFSAAIVYANLQALLMIGLITRRINSLRPELERLLGREEMERIRPFARLSSIWGPVLFSLFLGVGWMITDLWRSPGVLTELLHSFSIIGWIPAYAGLWFFIVMLLDLDRIGRSGLRLAPFEHDPTLGLRPLGSIAAIAFVAVSVVFVLLTIIRVSDVRLLIFNLIMYLILTSLFVLSVWRLHDRMQQSKARHVAEARLRFAEAFRQVISAWAADGGSDQAAARLVAAEVMERRALSIHEWPLGEGTFGRVTAIFTAVVAAILARLVLSAIGFR